MQEIETVIMPFSPSEHPLFARFVVITNESFKNIRFPTTIFIANDGELVAATTQKPLPKDISLSGFSVNTILSELEKIGGEQKNLITIYTGPLPPQNVKERVFTPTTS
jgi:hypothetical protein